MVSSYLCVPGTYMDPASAPSSDFIDCVPCSNTAGAAYGFCATYGRTTLSDSSGLAVEDGYKATTYLDSATPYYDARVHSNGHHSDFSPLYLHFEQISAPATAESTLEGLVNTAMSPNTFCGSTQICKDGAPYTSGVEVACPVDVYCPSELSTEGEECPPGYQCSGNAYTTRS